MADQIRGPLIVGRRDPPISRTTLQVGPSLLTTVLAVAGAIPLPLGAGESLPLQILSPAPRLQLAGDTSRGSPLTLLAPPVVPAQPQPQPSFVSTPRWAWQLRDTSAGTNPLLVPPVVQETVRPPLSLLPPFPQQPVAASFGTPKTLTADGTTPFAIAPQRLAEQPRALAAPTLGSPLPLVSFVAPAPVVPQVLPPATIAFPGFVSDTSRGTPKALAADAQAPIANLQQPLLSRIRAVADTSAGVNLPIATAPVFPPTIPPYYLLPVEYRLRQPTVPIGQNPPPPIAIPRNAIRNIAMAQRIQVDPKSFNEVRPVTIDFSPYLQTTESVTAVTAAVTVFSGTDAAPNALLGALSFTATTGTVKLLGGVGVVGVTYLVTVYASTGVGGSVYPVTFYLSIIPEETL